MIRPFAQRGRKAVLGQLNNRACRKVTKAIPADVMPSYIVVTPYLVHLAPLAASNPGLNVQPVFVANGVARPDISWLSELCPNVPVIELRTSLTGNAISLLEHGVVIDSLIHACRGNFCIQDADCFVTDGAIWRSLVVDEKTEFAAGPFDHAADEDAGGFPDTFLVCLNGSLFREYQRTFGLSAECTGRPGLRVRRLLAKAGFAPGRFLDHLKDYFDTLHLYWIAGQHYGFQFRRVPGVDTSVHHIGGTSYLHNSFVELDHWDYWPLNVHYFHMRLLELPACARFRTRFARLFEHHGDADGLLSAYPAYASGWRRRQADRIIESLAAQSLYGLPD